MNINKKELVLRSAQKTGMTQRDSMCALDAATKIIMQALADGDSVQIKGFGIFERRKRSARKRHNPKTKELVYVPEMFVPAFKPGKQLKDAVTVGASCADVSENRQQL